MAQGGSLGAGDLAKKCHGTRHLYYPRDSTLVSSQRGISFAQERALFPIPPCIQSAPELQEADVPLPCVVPIAVERKNEDVIMLNECACTHIHIIEDLPLISPPQVDCVGSCCYFSDTPNRGQTWGEQQRPVESTPSKERRKGNSQVPSCLRLPMLYCGKAATLLVLW